jgi:hypothetical protein
MYKGWNHFTFPENPVRGNDLIKMHVFGELSKVILMLICARGISGDIFIE